MWFVCVTSCCPCSVGELGHADKEERSARLCETAQNYAVTQVSRWGPQRPGSVGAWGRYTPPRADGSMVFHARAQAAFSPWRDSDPRWSFLARRSPPDRRQKNQHSPRRGVLTSTEPNQKKTTPPAQDGYPRPRSRRRGACSACCRWHPASSSRVGVSLRRRS